MQIVRQLSEIVLSSEQKTILTIGSYDGMHRGHRKIIANVKQSAAHHHSLSALVAFHPRPKAVFSPTTKSDYLTTFDEKVMVFREMGLDIVAILPFTLEFAQTPAQMFVQRVYAALRPLEIWVGSDFKFGKDRQGDVTFLQTLGREMDFLVKRVDVEMASDEKISSTQIRNALAEGQIRRVTYLLGAYPFLLGQVVKGDQRGRTIGFPTANISVGKDKLLPANGVYAVWIHLAEDVYPAVANIGIRPTFGGVAQVLEVHIFGFDQDIYGQHVRVDLVDYLRPEQNFADLGLDALIAQIEIDVQQAQEILRSETRP